MFPAERNLVHVENMQNHAIKRLFERYGIVLPIPDYRKFCRMCMDGTSPPLVRGAGESTIHKLEFRGKTLWAIFRFDQRAIATFLPKTPHEIRKAGLV